MATDTAVETQAKPKTRTYFSRNENLTLTRVKPVEQVLPNGKTICTNKHDYDRFRVEFVDGFFYAKPGDLKAPNPDTGEAEDVVTFLENHPRFGQEFFLQEQSPPDPTEVIAQLSVLLSRGDYDGVKALYDEEKANWARPQVLEPIEAVVRDFDQREQQPQGE